MNAVTPVVPEGGPPRRAARPSRKRSDQEFLAPALEILETPPSPVRTSLIVAICALTVIALAWSWFGQVDIVAIAAGKIEPSDKVKTVEPLLTGRIIAILVRDGDVVRQGDPLVEFDTTELASEVDRLQNQHAALSADVLRLQSVLASLETAPHWTSTFEMPDINWDKVAVGLRTTEEGVMRRDLADLRAKLGSIESQIAQRRADMDGASATIDAQNRLIATMDTLVSMRSTLVDRQAGSKADWLGAMQDLETQQVTLAGHIAQRADDAAALGVLEQEGQKVWTEFLADYARTLNTTELQADDTAHKVDQAKAQVALMTLRSPIDGTVEASSLTSIGQVVSTGQEALRIVPSDAPVVVRAYLPNDEIGFVQIGQAATIKVAAFPFAQYGTLAGKVLAVGKDAVAGLGASGNGGQGSPVADATGSLLFPVTVELTSRLATLNGVLVTLSPGMQVTAEINTGKRRILEYLFAPIVEVSGSALHER